MLGLFPCISASGKCWSPSFCTSFWTSLWYSVQKITSTWGQSLKKRKSVKVKKCTKLHIKSRTNHLEMHQNTIIHCYNSFFLLLLHCMMDPKQGQITLKWAMLHIWKVVHHKTSSKKFLLLPSLSSHTCSAVFLITSVFS